MSIAKGENFTTACRERISIKNIKYEMQIIIYYNYGAFYTVKTALQFLFLTFLSISIDS